MARVLYSCCGEGQGHSSRVHTVTNALMQLGHEVKVLASNKAFAVLNPTIAENVRQTQDQIDSNNAQVKVLQADQDVYKTHREAMDADTTAAA